ncbi:MAG: hypothetical protein L3I99_05035 [Sulfurimonas sp.]|nr:hypothetical protein [Sulfurimonas sp.]
MKKIALALLLPFILLCEELQYKGNIGFEQEYFLHDIKGKRDNALALRLEAEFKYELYNSEIAMKVKGIFDKEDENRRYVDFNELYYKYNFDDSDILIGRNIRFWGALEFHNLVDIFNTKDFLDNPFDYDSKLGTWNVSATHYLENSEISLIVKLKEENQPMQDRSSIYYFLPQDYNENLKSKNRPSVFLKYSGSGDELQIDYSFIYLNGFDNNRYLSFEKGKLRQNAYIVNKFLSYATLVLDSTIYKGEYSYTLSDDEKISNYTEVGVGLEHTLYSFYDNKDLGLLVEYYKNDSNTQSFFANDLTLGFRLSLNDMSSSEILGGFSVGLDNHEKIMFIKYDTRVFQKYKLALSYQKLAPKSDSVFAKLQSAKLEFTYYF